MEPRQPWWLGDWIGAAVVFIVFLGIAAFMYYVLQPSYFALERLPGA
ncbi:MAG: hypothetical protein WKH64_12555 [Chloroflexia bacterium]